MSLDQALDRWKDIPIRTRGVGLLIVATLVLLGMVAHEQIRRVSGQEIIVKAHPVDPRDVLRGAYVALDYDIEQIDPNTLSEPPRFSAPLVGQTIPVWLVLDRAPEGWAVSRVLERKPGALGKDEVVLRALWRHAHDLSGAAGARLGSFAVDIGADRYFAEESRAKALQNAIRDGKFEVVLSVGGDGRAVIKGLVLDGARQDETLF